MKHRLRRRFIYIFVRVTAAALFLLPIKLAVFLAGRLGILLFFLLGRHRLQAIENLKLAFGSGKSDKEIFNIAKAVFANLGKGAAEFINFAKINVSNIDRFVRACGVEKIDRALKDKKGAIALVSHFGNWELTAAYFGLKGYPCNAITRPLRYEKYDRLVNSLRRSKNINILPREHSFRKIVSVLKSNQLIGILPDQDINSIEGVFVDFFGRKAYTPTGPVLLAMASGSVILPIFCIRENGRHKLVVEDPVELEITGDREKDVLVNTQKWSMVVEQYIRRYPQQWVWMHRRWKTQFSS